MDNMTVIYIQYGLRMIDAQTVELINNATVFTSVPQDFIVFNSENERENYINQNSLNIKKDEVFN